MHKKNFKQIVIFQTESDLSTQSYMNKVLVLSVVFATLTAATAMSISSVLAISCIQCAKEFAPWQEKFAEDSDFKSKSARSLRLVRRPSSKIRAVLNVTVHPSSRQGRRKLNSVT